MKHLYHMNLTAAAIRAVLKKVVFSAGGSLLLIGSICRADTMLFSDTFDTENGGNAQFGFASFAKWNVTRGDVDLIGNNGLDVFYPGHGLYVDLDGSPGQGRMESKTLFNLPSSLYRLSFELGNNPFLGSILQTNHARLSLAGVFSEDFTRVGVTPLDSFTRLISISNPTSGRLIIESLDPADFAGVVVDNVRLELIPEPATWLLFSLGFVAIAVRRASSIRPGSRRHSVG